MENLNSTPPVPNTSTAARAKRSISIGSIIDGFLNFISSVPFGIALLVILLAFSMIGMLIQQQELDTFANYFASLTPAEKYIYGSLGFFNIYHANYFNILLLVLSLNIILASIDYFPKAWKLMRRKKLTASPGFTQAMRIKVDPVTMPELNQTAIIERAKNAARALRYRVTETEKDGRTTIYAEKGAWNRMGPYIIHLALLTIFAGGMLTSLKSHTGGMWVQPGEKSDQITQNVFELNQVGERSLELPFSVEGLDIKQTLIDPKKFIDGGNTLDWLTRIRITDKTSGQSEEALVHMNKPYDYRGYRFFQASFREMGGARTVNVKITPDGGTPQDIKDLRLNTEAQLSDGTKIKYVEFVPSFDMGQDGRPTVTSPTYENPAAHLQITKPSGEKSDVWAFTNEYLQSIEQAPFLKSKLLPANGFKFQLLDFEKASQAHMLSIQYDPGSFWFYLGSTLLCVSLLAVFFYSHQRIWIVCEDGKAYLGGDANRNRLGLEDRMKKIAAKIQGITLEEKEA